ncbi:MAG: acetyl-CoA carboxylase biotin carboxylase subunit, partial [Chloroflexi bacterium]|nr:acetyl-CoA carboxylase biotin carboxylase subunit [Chloroflexota bacterium]
REEARVRMQRALGEMSIEGLETNILFHQVALDDDLFKSGEYTTDFIVKQNIVQKVRERAKILKRLDG